MMTGSQANASLRVLGTGLLLVATCARGAVFSRVEAGTGVVVHSNLAVATVPIVFEFGSQPASSKSGASKKVKYSAQNVSPALGLPKQSDREVDRREILTSELRSERYGLQAAKSQNAASEVIARHQSNVAALEREIERLR